MSAGDGEDDGAVTCAPVLKRLRSAWRHLGAALVIALVCVVAFAPALPAGFVFDDHVLIEQSEVLRGPLWRIWFTADAPDYWPLTYTSLWLEWRAWGANAGGYHVTNVALHAVAAILLWRALRRLGIPGAWLAGILFAVHPVGVESVAWISERKNTLSGVFFFGALLAWLRHEEDRRRATWWVALALFVLALLAKTSTVMLPVVLLAASAIRRGRLGRGEIATTAPFFGLSLLAGAVTWWFQHTFAMANAPTIARTFAERAGAAGWALGSYVQKAFIPAGLGFVYPERWPVAPGEPLFYAPLALLAGSALLLWRARRGWGRAPALALGYHAVLLLPVVGLVDIAYFQISPVSNHLQYLALAGPVALVASAIARSARGRAEVPVWLGAMALVAALANATFARAAAFRDDVTLWREASAAQPDSLYALWMTAEALAERGDGGAAVSSLLSAAERAGDPSVRRRALALALVHSGRTREAMAQVREAERIAPNPGFSLEVGAMLARAGRAAEAIELLEPVVAAFPEVPDGRYWLASALTAEGRLEEAAALLRERPGRARRDGRMREALSLVLARMGSLDESRAELAAARGTIAADPEVVRQVAAWARSGAAP